MLLPFGSAPMLFETDFHGSATKQLEYIYECKRTHGTLQRLQLVNVPIAAFIKYYNKKLASKILKDCPLDIDFDNGRVRNQKRKYVVVSSIWEIFSPSKYQKNKVPYLFYIKNLNHLCNLGGDEDIIYTMHIHNSENDIGNLILKQNALNFRFDMGKHCIEDLLNPTNAAWEPDASRQEVSPLAHNISQKNIDKILKIDSGVLEEILLPGIWAKSNQYLILQNHILKKMKTPILRLKIEIRETDFIEPRFSRAYNTIGRWNAKVFYEKSETYI